MIVQTCANLGPHKFINQFPLSYYSSSYIWEINRFRPIEGHTFLGTIVRKSSIKDQFGPLQIRNLEELVPLLAINDHFVPKKHQSTFRFHQKEHKDEEQSVLAFQNQERERL